jgi:SAM-dependent methyltransferase
MINRIIKKIKFLFLQSKVGSFHQFKRIEPFDRIDSEKIDLSKEQLRPYYEQYVKEISRADMAISLELAAFLYAVCKENHYTKLLDVGSGLSSFVFRLYAKDNPGVIVFSIDDDALWLEKTKDFLKLHQLGTENVFTFDQFLKSQEKEFDFVLHDLNFVEIRINYIEQLMRVTKKNGLLILDDVHKPDYRYAVLCKLRDIKGKTYDIRTYTFDNYGRFSFAVIKD